MPLLQRSSRFPTSQSCSETTFQNAYKTAADEHGAQFREKHGVYLDTSLVFCQPISLRSRSLNANYLSGQSVLCGLHYRDSNRTPARSKRYHPSTPSNPRPRCRGSTIPGDNPILIMAVESILILLYMTHLHHWQ